MAKHQSKISLIVEMQCFYYMCINTQYVAHHACRGLVLNLYLFCSLNRNHLPYCCSSVKYICNVIMKIPASPEAHECEIFVYCGPALCN